MSHTSGPWTVDRWADGQGGKGISIKDGDGLCIANLVGQLDDSEMRKARLIVLAVNAHKGLLEALKLAEAYVGRGIAVGAFDGCAVSGEHALERITTAISKAGG
jgi:hypothetical protein